MSTTETISWIVAAERLPDAELNVLCFDQESTMDTWTLGTWRACALRGKGPNVGIERPGTGPLE